jgi:WD40 repeat protein
VWDAATGSIVFTLATTALEGDEEGQDPYWWDILFTPDSSALLASVQGAGRIVRFSTADWTRTQTAQLDLTVFGAADTRLLGYDAQGRLIGAGAASGFGGAALYWLDPDTFELVASIADAHVGSLKSASISPDGTTLATGASDGIIRAWDTRSQALLQEIHLPAQVQGLAFADGTRLLAAPDGGSLLEFTLDPAELESLVRGSLTRGFTPTECVTYEIDPCPTLEEMQADAGAPPS